MRLSKSFFTTLRETPGDAEIASHRLMLRAGLIRRLSSGIYNYLPMGYRALKKVENIIREEMDRAGAQELLMPALQPVELWEESGRLDVYVSENILFRCKDRQDRWYALGPTHEEVVCDVARSRIKSYRDLPFNLYQIQTKFRDEIRPRFGLMRGKEFIMKDAYSFDVDVEGMNASYDAMYNAYVNIFRRCGLRARPVEADSGAIGGDASHEFMILAESGEDTVVFCGSCDYAANMEKAEVGGEFSAPENPEMKDIVDIETPNVRTIEELTAFLKIKANKLVKTLVYKADGKPYVALIRGDRQLNEIKLKRILGASEVELADEKTINEITGAPVGFAGPQGLDKKVDIIMDREVLQMVNFYSGANRAEAHVKNINHGRDFQAKVIADIREAADGDQCPRCAEGKLSLGRGVEVGHVFKLGTKYSKKMNVVYTDSEGAEHPAIMGCYGIGVGRTLAAVVEEHNDENGIIFPVSIAPYTVVVIPIAVTDSAQMVAAEEIYGILNDAGIETVMDDRDERPGVKFKDADLVGYPIKLVVGKGIAEGKVEISARRVGEKNLIDKNEALAVVRGLIEEQS